MTGDKVSLVHGMPAVGRVLGVLYQRPLILTHGDRVGDPPVRQGGRRRCGASARLADALRRFAHATGSAAAPRFSAKGFRAASRAASDAPHRRATRFLPKTFGRKPLAENLWPKTLGSRLHGSISRAVGITWRRLAPMTMADPGLSGSRHGSPGVGAFRHIRGARPQGRCSSGRARVNVRRPRLKPKRGCATVATACAGDAASQTTRSAGLPGAMP